MIVTDLWNLAFPFIRYENGDAITFLARECSCGRHLPLMKVKGRADDILLTTEGPVSPAFLIHNTIGPAAYSPHSNSKPGIRMVQLIQKPGYVVEVNLVKNAWCTSEEIAAFKNSLAEILPGMTILVNEVDDIRATRMGKRRFIWKEDQELLERWTGKD